MDVAVWLESLGLQRYLQAFREHDVEERVLPGLTGEDLKEIGVTSIGHRRLLLEAIAELRRTPRDERPTAPSPLAAAEIAGAGTPERRQLTVLFCDVVGSTELSARLDPEDMRDVIRAYQNMVAGEIARFEGHIAKFMGDGVLAYFGYPRAHEDEAERAIRAGLALVEAISRLDTPTGAPLSARVGIATGLVVVGDLLGEGGAQEQAVVGDTPNLAARLQTLALPGMVVIGQATRRLVGGLFELDDLGPQQLKGFAEPLAAWRVSGESRVEGRFEALHGERLTPLVGREHELALLLERWAHAKDGDGQVVLLAGEPGIGKSRIARMLSEGLAEEPHVRLRYFCSPYHTNSALHPVLDQLRRAAGFVASEPPEARLAKLEAVLRNGARDVDEAVALLAPLLSIPLGGRSPALDFGAQRQKQRTLEVLVEQLEGLAAHQPALMIFEDAHWVDATTLELLDLIVKEIAGLRVLLIITFRPEFAPPWTGYAHVTKLSLNRLSHRQAGVLVERLSGGKRLPTEVLAQIVARTDGVPLFVEELTKTVLESGLLTDAGDHFDLAGPLPALAIPATLQDSLLARLDRLVGVKEVAQIGAVIGRNFSYALIEAVAPLDQDGLRAALEQLTASGLVVGRGTPPDATYGFKHALVQEAAYGTLLRGRRQQLHARIAKLLEGRFPDVAESQPELLAHHYTEAGLPEEAIFYWRRAGERSARASADVEAVAHLKKALQLLDTLPETRARTEQALGLCLTLGSALSNLQGAGGAEVGQVYLRARELCARVGRPEQLFAALWGLWGYHHMNGRLEAAEEMTDEVIRLGQQLSDSGFLLQAHHAAWTTRAVRGDLAPALHHAEEGFSLYDIEQHGPHAFIYGGHDPGVCAGWHMAELAWTLGFPDRALAHAHKSLRLGQQLGHPISLAMVQSMMVNIHAFRGELQSAAAYAEEMLKYTAEHELTVWLVNARMLRARISTALGHGREVIEGFREAVEQRAARGARRRQAFYLALLAEAFGRNDRLARGHRCHDEGSRADRQYRRGTLGAAGLPYPSDPPRWFERDPAGCGGLLQQGATGRPESRREILRAPSCHRPRPPVERTRRDRSSTRPPRAGLWLVHRGLRYRGSQGSQDAARRTPLTGQPPRPAFNRAERKRGPAGSAGPSWSGGGGNGVAQFTARQAPYSSRQAVP